MQELIAGFAHPLHGGDHLLAMLAVGLWAARLGGAALWALPTSFVGFTLAGFAGVPLPGLEPMLAASVFLLGLAIAAALRLPVWAGSALVALFALFHGHAHYVELPEGASPAIFAAGLLLSTAALHAAGITLGLMLARARSWLPRAVGGAISLAGACLLLG